MFLRSLIVIACLSALVPAQRGGETSPEEHARLKRQAIQEGADVKENSDKGDPDNNWEKMTPEQRLNHNIRHGASAYCRFVMSVKPAKLMPGQTGTLIVTAILQGQAVMPAPAPLEILSSSQQGFLTLGAASFRPAAPGKLAQGYLGKPVYDNFAIFEVPVTLGTEAAIGGKLPVALDLKFDLYDGVSTQPVGRFTDRASTEIEVGQVADPSVTRGVHADGGNAVATRTAAAEKGSDAEQGISGRPSGEKTIDAAPISAPVEDGPSPTVALVPTESALLADDDSGLPLPPALLIGGGVALVLLLLLFVKRR